MSTLILRTAARYLFPLLLLFSFFLLWRGHHEPGGGFVGGLVAATAFVLVALADGAREARALLRIAPARLAVLGVSIAVAAGLVALPWDRPFLTATWSSAVGSGAPKLGTPLLFDFGVYLSVVGVVLTFLLALLEESE